ncbi:GGDEF domain-containing protein [Parasphingorhabdus sp.]|uniref:GGDEF domain-containing protein n=1 Tax=Parasphingorhabdus sp. TaxID=2709688 RepID=UPI003001B251
MNTTLSNLSPVRQTAIVTAIAALLSVALTSLMYLLSYGLDDRFWSAINMALVIPLVITVPLGLHTSRQRFKLVGLANRLQEAQSSLREANKALERRANFDGLTGLLSRDSFFNQLDQVRVDNRANILMIVDVDHFKNINDNFGHPVGDQALILLGKIFRKTLRHTDLVGRIGGEEFGIYLPDTSVPEGQIIGEIIRHEIENTVFEPYPNMHHVLTVSVGLTDVAPHQQRAALMGNADTALFTAKRRGRNQVVLFEPGLRTKPRPVHDKVKPLKSTMQRSNFR